MNCIICLFPIDGIKFTCSRPSCNEVFCDECLIALIKYSTEEVLLPICPSRNCQQVLLLCDIKELIKENKSILGDYEKCCLQFFLKSDGDGVKQKIQEKQLMEQLKKDRQQFITQTYPEPIALIASISFKNKLNKLEKEKQKIAKEQELLNKRKCMNGQCTGHLDDDDDNKHKGVYECDTCENKFCIKCEKKIGKKHECKKEDLDSVSIVNDMIRCPGCKLPVFKNVGCNHITCSNCDTKFEYTTGEISEHGSNNAKLNVDLNQIKPLSFTHKGKLSKEGYNLLVEVEAKKPKEITKDVITNALKGYYTKDVTTCGNKVVRALERYYLGQFAMKRYMKGMIKIEEMMNEGKKEKKIIKRLETMI